MDRETARKLGGGLTYVVEVIDGFEKEHERVRRLANATLREFGMEPPDLPLSEAVSWVIVGAKEREATLREIAARANQALVTAFAAAPGDDLPPVEAVEKLAKRCEGLVERIITERQPRPGVRLLGTEEHGNRFPELVVLLANLLADPQPGLATWSACYAKHVNELRSLLNEEK